MIAFSGNFSVNLNLVHRVNTLSILVCRSMFLFMRHALIKQIIYEGTVIIFSNVQNISNNLPLTVFTEYSPFSVKYFTARSV